MARTPQSQAGAAGHTPEPGQGEREQRTSQSEQAGTQPGQRQQLQGSQSAQGQDVTVGQGGAAGATEPRRGQGLAAYGRDPFAMMERLSQEMDQLFDSFFYGRPLARTGRQSQIPSLWAPEVDICEEGNQLRLSVDLPGVPKDAVKIDIQEGMLTIQGERREERTEGGEQQGFRRTERRYGSFYRSIPLPDGADAEHAQARMKEGVLEITIPLAQKQGRRLQIED
jgi:HSP20 family protein